MLEALVLANRDDADSGLVGQALAARGYHLTTVSREDDDEAWPAPARSDLVVVLGSDWSVYGEHVRAPVERESRFVATAVDAGMPVLGICFGAQLLAAAFGGDARPAATTELGWLDVEPLDERIEPGPWFQFHSDTFKLPDDATLLARSRVGPQAFRIGSALGLQFHPEVTPEIVARWTAADPRPVARAGFTAEQLVARTAAEQPRAREAAARLVDMFLATTP